MTDYDLRTRKALRRVMLLEYGIGPETMQQRKDCPACGRAIRAQDTHCTDCGAALPEKTLYVLYRARHRCCLPRSVPPHRCRTIDLLHDGDGRS